MDVVRDVSESTVEFGNDVGESCSDVVVLSPIDCEIDVGSCEIEESTVWLLSTESVGLLSVLSGSEVVEVGVEVAGGGPLVEVFVSESTGAEGFEFGIVSEASPSSSSGSGAVLGGCADVNKEVAID